MRSVTTPNNMKGIRLCRGLSHHLCIHVCGQHIKTTSRHRACADVGNPDGLGGDGWAQARSHEVVGNCASLFRLLTRFGTFCVDFVDEVDFRRPERDLSFSCGRTDFVLFLLVSPPGRKLVFQAFFDYLCFCPRCPALCEAHGIIQVVRLKEFQELRRVLLKDIDRVAKMMQIFSHETPVAQAGIGRCFLCFGMALTTKLVMSASFAMPTTAEILQLPERCSTDARSISRKEPWRRAQRAPKLSKSGRNVAQQLSKSCPMSRETLQIRPTVSDVGQALAKFCPTSAIIAQLRSMLVKFRSVWA